MYLLAGDGHGVGDIGEDCGLDEVALVSNATASRFQLCSFLPAGLDQPHRLREDLVVYLVAKHNSKLYLYMIAISYVSIIQPFLTPN